MNPDSSDQTSSNQTQSNLPAEPNYQPVPEPIPLAQPYASPAAQDRPVADGNPFQAAVNQATAPSPDPQTEPTPAYSEATVQPPVSQSAAYPITSQQSQLDARFNHDPAASAEWPQLDQAAPQQLPTPADTSPGEPPAVAPPVGSQYSDPTAVEMARAKIAALAEQNYPGGYQNQSEAVNISNDQIPPAKLSVDSAPIPESAPPTEQPQSLAAQGSAPPPPFLPTEQVAAVTDYPPEALPDQAPLSAAVTPPSASAAESTPYAPPSVSLPLAEEPAAYARPANTGLDQTPAASAEAFPPISAVGPPPVAEPARQIIPPVAALAGQYLAHPKFGTFQLPPKAAEPAAAPEVAFETGQVQAPATAVQPPAQAYAPAAVPLNAPPMPGAVMPPPGNPAGTSEWLPTLVSKVSSFYKGRAKFPGRLKPILGAGAIGLVIFFLFNSQVIIGQIQYLTNSGNDSEIAAGAQVTTETVGPEPLIIIPKINVNVPVVYDEPTFEEAKVQKALERGVVHYGNTAVPGQPGNNVIVGHSSNNWWASGQYKFAFVLLDKLEVGDTFVLHYNSKKYIYQVSNKTVVEPTNVGVLAQTTTEPTVTLITCTPPGTSLRRLVVQAKQISPDPSGVKPPPAADADNNLPNQLPGSNATEESEDNLPGNTPSLLEQVKRRLFGD